MFQVPLGGRMLTGALVATLLLAGCSSEGGEEGAEDTNAEPAEQAEDDATDDTGTGDQDRDSGGGDGPTESASTLTIDGSPATVGLAFCALETQEVGSQSIDASATVTATTETGEEVSMDFARFAGEGVSSGDSVEVVLGDDAYSNAASPEGIPPSGTVAVEGSTVSAADLVLSSLAGDGGITVSFTIQC